MMAGCLLCGHEPARHTTAAGCTVPGPNGWECWCYLAPAFAAEATQPHRVRISRTRRLFGGASYWPRCSCRWEGLSYFRRGPAVQDEEAHLAEMAALQERARGQATEPMRRGLLLVVN